MSEPLAEHNPKRNQWPTEPEEREENHDENTDKEEDNT